MAYLQRAFTSPPRSSHPGSASPVRPEDSNADGTSSRPLSGPGSSRQTRRLQLRNAGFRGATITPRKVSPKLPPTGNECFLIGGTDGLSDLENLSPLAPSSTGHRRGSKGVLQEIGISEPLQPRKHRHGRPSSHIPRSSGDSTDRSADRSGSPASVRGTIRAKSAKSRTKAVHRRRSGSNEANRYIEHLEAELAAAQSQLISSVPAASTAVTNSRTRALETEVKQLHEELAAWEEMYDQRLQQELDKHSAVEATLRDEIKILEQDAEDLKIKVQDLEIEAAIATEKHYAVEAANINMEKRVEMMSELLAASNIDLYAGTPGRTIQQGRPKSMLPRFPTANSLACSPERQPRTQPSSPRMSFVKANTTALTFHGNDSSSPEDSPPPPPQSASELLSDAESLFSEAVTTGDSATSAEAYEGGSSLNAWGLPVLQKPRTTRRMRKFGPGSVGPKPLILPTTNQCTTANNSPVSAPMERRDTAPTIFPRSICDPVEVRRRSSTTVNESTVANLASLPFLIVPPLPECPPSPAILEVDRPSSAGSLATTGRPSTANSGEGQNLMDELGAVRTDESVCSTDRGFTTSEEVEEARAIELSVPASSDEDFDVTPHDIFGTLPRGRARLRVDRQLAISPGTLSTASSRDFLLPSYQSFLDHLRLFFGDLWHSPVVLARHLIRTAQAHIRTPPSLLTVQWWLVGVLLGPMARRRLISSSDCCSPSSGASRTKKSTALIPSTPESQIQPALDSQSQIIYSSSPSPSDSSQIVKSRKRLTGYPRIGCPHCSKHSPWLWLKFSLTLAVAIGSAFTAGPGSLLHQASCGCHKQRSGGACSRRAVTR